MIAFGIGNNTSHPHTNSLPVFTVVFFFSIVSHSTPCESSFSPCSASQPRIGFDDGRVTNVRNLQKGQTFHHNIPYIAHKTLAMVTPSAHGWRVNKSVLLGEIDRIYHKVRPSLAYQPMQDYLNSRSIVSFDDETRSIRAKTAELLKKIYTPIPRAQRPLSLTGDTYYSHTELPITERIISDNYIDRLLSSGRDVRHNVLTMSYYDEPARRYSGIGKSHLACISFAGGRPISRRRNLASGHDNIRNDINVLSHYGRFRAAAATAAATNVPDADYTPLPYRPPTKSAVTGSWKSNAPHRSDSDKSKRDANRPRAFTAGAEFDASLERKKKRREALEAAALREAQEEKRQKEQSARQEELAQQATLEREEQEKKDIEEAERLEEERRAREEAERKIKEEEERLKRQEEEERLRKEEEERLKREEEERLKREEEERLKREEEERLKREEEERLKREEEERLKREEEERLKREEEERLKREEEERLKREEEERLKREEEERLKRQEEERLKKEEEERLAREEEEKIAREEEERRVNGEEEERKAQEETDRPAKQEEEQLAEEEQMQEQEEEPANEETAEPVVEEPSSPEAPEAPEEEEEEEVQEEE